MYINKFSFIIYYIIYYIMPRKNLITLNNNQIHVLKEKILFLLNINDTNNTFNLLNTDTNITLQQKIYELADFCQLYFPISNWTYFRNKRENKLNTRSYLTLIRNIFNFCEVNYNIKQTSTIINGNLIYYTKYIINI